MRVTTRVLVICIHTGKILFWIKRKSGMITAPGGGKESYDKTLRHTISRELREETKIQRKFWKFIPYGWLRIYKDQGNVGYRLTKIVHLFVIYVDSTKIKLRNTKEMYSPVWYPVSKLPFNLMSPYYKVWAKEILDGPVCKDIWLDATNDLVTFLDVEPDQEAAEPASTQRRR